jgi:hypothetical protein
VGIHRKDPLMVTGRLRLGRTAGVAFLGLGLFLAPIFLDAAPASAANYLCYQSALVGPTNLPNGSASGVVFFGPNPVVGGGFSQINTFTFTDLVFSMTYNTTYGYELAQAYNASSSTMNGLYGYMLLTEVC